MENQRIRVSKAMLKEALLKLLQKEDLGRITVAQLCDTAQINRTTFYKYYVSTYDLLAEIENDLFEELEETLNNSSLSEKDMLSYNITFLDKNRDKMKVLFNALSNDSFFDHLMRQSFISTFFDREILQNFPPSESKYMRLFISHGIYAIIRDWISSDNPASREELIALILSIRKRFELNN